MLTEERKAFSLFLDSVQNERMSVRVHVYLISDIIKHIFMIFLIYNRH
jgi:hypothetical protein